jgi:hypothetical protein
MSDEKQEVIDVTPETTSAPEAPAEEAKDKQVDLQYGFLVGVRQDGGVMLEMVGEKKGLIEMLGLCKYAEYHLGYTLDAASGQGSPVISQQIHQLAEMMKVLLNVIANNKKQQEEQRIVTP